MPLTRRLILVTLLVAVPLLLLATGFVVNRAASLIHEQAQQQLQLTATELAATIEVWFQANVQMMDNLALSPEIKSMQAERQIPVLKALAATHPYLYLVHTIGLDGFNVARNDDQENRDYSDRQYVIDSLAGKPFSTQVVIGRTSGQPALILAAPVRNEAGEIVGVASVAANLTDLSNQVKVSQIGQTGYSYLVDESGKVLAHPDPEVTAQLLDMSAYPPVAALLSGQTGAITFTDEQGLEWHASTTRLTNGWGVIVQQQATEQDRPVALFVQFSILAALVGVVGLSGLTWLNVRTSLAPVKGLTEAAQALSSGKLSYRAVVDREDELGILAQTFNQMAEQLSAMVNNLQEQVSERSRALQTTAEIGRRLATLSEVSELADTVVREVQRAFAYYHVQIYLWDERKEALQLVGGTGEAGVELLQRGHKLPRGQGLVGRAASTNQYVLVADTSADPGWLPNPLLPGTQAELAMPISLGEEVLGVLDVQQNTTQAFSEPDIELLQTLANQIAIALLGIRQLQDIRLSQARYETMLEYAPEAIVVVDADSGLFLEPNENAVRLYGLSREELLKVGPDDVSPPLQPDGRSSTEKAREMVGRALAGEAPVFEWVHRNSAGQDIPCEVRLVRMPSAGRNLVRASVTDITLRKQSEAIIAKQAADLATVAEITTQIAAILQPEKLLQAVSDQVKAGFQLYHAHIYLLNDAGSELVLAAGAGEVGQKMTASGWRIPADAPRSLVAQAARERSGVIVNDVQAEPDFLPNPLLPNTAAEMAVPLIAAGRVLGVLDVQSDRVGRFSQTDVAIFTSLASQVAVALQNARQYQQTLESEQLVRTIIDATPDWIFIKDRQHRYRLVNKGYADALHLNPEDFIGKDDLELGFPEELVKGNPEKGIRGFWADDRLVMESGQPQLYPNDPATIDGELHIFNTFKTPLRDENGQVWGVLAFSRDITERERLRQETEERLAEVDALYRAMSREAWRSFHQSTPAEMAFFYDQTSVQPAGDLWEEVTEQVIQRKTPLMSTVSPKEEGVVAAPLKLRGEVIGSLAVQVSPQKPLDPGELEILEQFSEQISLALESARLFEETRQRSAELAELNQITATASRSLDVHQVLGEILSRVLNLMGFDAGLVSLEDLQTHRLVLDAHLNLPEAMVQRLTTQGLENTPCDLVAQLGQVVVAGDLHRLPENLREWQAVMERPMAFGFQAYLGVPLEAKGEVLGTICLFNKQPVEIGTVRQTLLQAIGQQLGVAVDNSRLFAQTQQALSETQALYQIIAEMNAARSYDEILGALAEQTVLRNADQLLLMGIFDRPLRGEQRPDWIMPVAHRAEVPIQIARRYPVSSFEAVPNTLFTPQPVFLPNLVTDQRLDRVTRTLFQQVFQAQSSLVVPLVLADEIIGFIQAYFSQTMEFSNEEIQRLSAVAGQAALAVQSRLLLQQAEARARQEQRLRQVTSEVFRVSDVDAILRRAVEQVGRALGLPAYIYLGEINGDSE